MIILFANKKLEKDCNEEKQRKKTWGTQGAKVLGRRLDQLRAASSLEDMRSLPGRCHQLTGDRAGQLSLDLVHPNRLIFEPADDPLPTKEDGGLMWSGVEKVRILGVEDTHD